MEEELWASCGNCDSLTPWDLSSLSTKSSPMLSMMLGVEREDHLAILEVLPSCVWISFSMCLQLCCLNFLQLLLVLSHGPNLCFSLSSPPSIPRCPIATSSSRIFFFQFPEQNMYWNIAPLRSAQIFLSNESSFAQNWFRTIELCPFYPSAAICPDEFQNAQRPKFLPYLLIRVFKFIDFGCVGTGISWRS